MQVRGKLILMLVMTVVFILSQSCNDEYEEVSSNVKEEMVPVYDYELYTRTVGTATPNVVLMTGIAGSTDDFKSIEQSLSGFSTVINYDREGIGRSAWQNKPKDSETIAQELNTLLEKKNITSPFILVAHSLGGLHARKFIEMYPEKVSGLVLIDPTPEDLLETIISQLPSEHQQPTRDAMQQEFENMLNQLPEGGIQEEFKAIETCYQQARALNNTVSIPVEIISSMKVTEGTSDMSVAIAKQLRDQLLSQYCTGANRHTLTYTAGHFIQKEEPQLVIDALKWVINNQ